ncbi:MAG: hypothetical protein PHG16_10220 [Lachnospiraceae bacterium]|nr:hypothetical protein [Lachnospiraceae bacterium]
MKYKAMILATGLAIGTILYTGCVSTASGSTSSVSSKEAEEDVIYGQVTTLEAESITIQVGTRKTMEKPSEDSKDTEDSAEVKASSDGKEMSMLDLTDEEKTFTITENTDLVKQSMGGGGQKPSGEKLSDEAPSEEESGEAPEKPSGDTSDSEKQREEKGEAPSDPGDGEAPKADTEDITAENIAVGDTVFLTLDSDGNAETITLLSMRGEAVAE